MERSQHLLHPFILRLVTFRLVNYLRTAVTECWSFRPCCSNQEIPSGVQVRQISSNKPVACLIPVVEHREYNVSIHISIEPPERSQVGHSSYQTPGVTGRDLSPRCYLSVTGQGLSTDAPHKDLSVKDCSFLTKCNTYFNKAVIVFFIQIFPCLCKE